MIYLQTNLCLAAAWVLFRLLPSQALTYRARKVLAQSLLIVSAIALPVLSMLPDKSFPDLATPAAVLNGNDVDGGERTAASPGRQVLRQAAAAVAAAPKKMRGTRSALLVVFLTGLLAMAARRIWNIRRLSRLLRNTLTLHQIGRTSVMISEQIAVPFSALLSGRAYVVLPSELVLHREDFRIALRHEIEHHRRRDTLWAVLLEWFVCAFYLNPAAYLWRGSILQLQELACDEALIGRMGISQQAYGSCLLRVAEMALNRRFMYAGTTCMIPAAEPDSRSFLTRRIKMFAQHKRRAAKRATAVAFGILSGTAIMAAAYMAQAASRSSDGPNPGKPVWDHRFQSLAETALKKGMAEHGASAGFAIVSDPVRGTVIAAVSVNDGFDPKLKEDWALSYPVEPGSAIKPLLVASALQHGATKPGEIHDTGNGEYAFGRNLYHDSEPYKELSTTDTVVHSSNIGMIKIGQKMGAKGIESALHEFGIGNGGSVQDFPGARSGFVPSAGTIADEEYIGLLAHGSSNRTQMFVTPIEMVEAYGAIANGGRLMKAIGADGKRSPDMIRDVLSAGTAKEMRAILRKVVLNGTGERIKNSAIPLAGKTSTVENGNRRITGFIGYAPADDPKLVIYVAMFDPKGPERAGSNTAAPVFREIAEKAVPLFNP
jgi:beta-lactamase regulating signal transducer with metallopeptidase domain